MGNKNSLPVATNGICKIEDFAPNTIVQIRGDPKQSHSYSIASIKSIRSKANTLDLQLIKDAKRIQLNDIAIKRCLPIYAFTVRDEELLLCGYLRTYIGSDFNRMPRGVLSLVKRFRHIYDTDNIELVTDRLIDNTHDVEDRATAIATIRKDYAFKHCGVLKDIASIKMDILSVDLRHFEYCTAESLRFLLEFMNYHGCTSMEPIAKPIRSVKMGRILADIWDADWVNSFTKHTIFTLIEMCLSLRSNDCLQVCIAKIATLFKGKSEREFKAICLDEEHNIDWFQRIQFYIDIKTGIDGYLSHNENPLDSKSTR
eukprot:282544_1